MNSELMTDMLASLNRRLQLKQRKIILFMDNAPAIQVVYKVKFPTQTLWFTKKKKKTSKTQPFDSGAIARWSYKKRLLSHVCSKVDGSNSASDIGKSVEWGRQAWDDVSKELGSTIKKLRRRTILLGEKHFQDRRNSLRQWKYPGLQKRF